MRYLGSKTLLVDKIFELVESYDTDAIFCDPFGGIGTVGAYMKKRGFTVITGDILNFAHMFQMALVENNGRGNFEKLKKRLSVEDNADLIRILDEKKADGGWIVTEYAEKRSFFTVENARHIQGCLDAINAWEQEGLLNDMEYAVLIASLIHSFDKVANTAGTYYAYLKDYYRKAKQKFHFQLLNPTDGNAACKACLTDANELVRDTECEILYLDPPYNERDYGKYYHLPENIARGITPKPTGKSGVYMPETVKSRYNGKRATEAFEDLIEHADAKCIIFHYTDKGLITVEETRRILSRKGDVEEFYFDCKGYHTSKISEVSQHHIFKVTT